MIQLLHIIHLLLVLFPPAASELQSQTYELPSLLIVSSTEYIQRGRFVFLTCQIMSGWSGLLQNVTWFKDGAALDTKDIDEYSFDGPTLNITGTRPQSEGEYQCQGNIKNIVISNQEVVDTILISSPLKLRRARITKFDKVSEIIMHVTAGELIRLPCAGMPDVVPGPPQVFFEKDGREELLGSSSESAMNRFLSSASGMQIAMVQAQDQGSYVCVVRNEHTGQYRKSPKAVLLYVDDGAKKESPPMNPSILFPSRRSSIKKPITVDVVEKQDVLLECVFASAKVIWQKHKNGLSTTLRDDGSHVRPLWGNLKMSNITQEDSGIYSCHGRSPLHVDRTDTAEEEESNHSLYYNVVVHAPTSVSLSLSQNDVDSSWQLSCHAHNLRYEIPMVFVNATPLIDAVDMMGLATSTNFYTNPINVTIVAKNAFTGSVQCISRPAMEEAEIYGKGLERGRSVNYYVVGGRIDDDNLITSGPRNTTALLGQNILLPCAIKKVHSKYWLKDGKFLQIYSKRIYLEKANTLVINKVIATDEGWYTCVVEGTLNGVKKTYKSSAYLKVEDGTSHSTTPKPENTSETAFQWQRKRVEHATLDNIRAFVAGSDVRLQWRVEGPPGADRKITKFIVQQRKSEVTVWKDADTFEPHVRAATISDLVPNARYQFRVVALRDDGTKATSEETVYMTVDVPLREVTPPTPELKSLEALSPTSIKVSWQYFPPHSKATAARFYISYATNLTKDASVVKLESNETSYVINDLRPNMMYQVAVLAENSAGRSRYSPTRTVRTPDMSSVKNGVISLLSKGAAEITSAWDKKMIAVIVASSLVILVVLLASSIICCALCRKQSNKTAKAANGKFLDTSYRIFHEQRVNKSKVGRPYDGLPLNGGLFAVDSIDEGVPLKGNNEDDQPCNSLHFRHEVTLPNVYGQGEEEDEDIDERIREPDYAFLATSTPLFPFNSGTSHQMVLPPLFSSNGNGKLQYPTSSTLQHSVPSHFASHPSSKVAPPTMTYRISESTITYSPASNCESGQTCTTAVADSPTFPLLVYGQNADLSENFPQAASSRNSQISSGDGRSLAMHTFKAGPSSLNNFTFPNYIYPKPLSSQAAPLYPQELSLGEMNKPPGS